MEIFDALLGPTKLSSAQLSVQTGNTQLSPLCTLNHLFYSVCVNNSAIQFTSCKGCEMNGEWRMAVMLNSCVEKSSITKKKRAKERCHICALLPQNACVISKKANNSNVRCVDCFSLFLMEEEHPHSTSPPSSKEILIRNCFART